MPVKLWAPPQPFWATITNIWSPSQRCFPPCISNWNFPCSCLCLLPFVPPLCISEKSLALATLHPPFRSLQTVVRIFWAFPSPIWKKTRLLSLSSYVLCYSPLSSGTSIGLVFLSSTGESTAGLSILACFTRAERKEDFSHSAAGCAFANAAQADLDISCMRILLAYVEIVLNTTRAFFCPSAFLVAWSPTCTVAWS